jgi:cell division protein FtsW
VTARAATAGKVRSQSRAQSGGAPSEYSLLLTATLCLLAFGAVMVFSASSTTQVLSDGGIGNSAFYLKRTVLFGIAGLLVMRLLAVGGVRLLRSLTPVLLAVSMLLLVVVLGIGSSANGAQRWIGSGFIQVQPSELAKFALVLYGAHLLAEKPKRVRSIEGMMPFLLLSGGACLLIVLEPDLGSALVVAFAVTATLIAGGARMRDLALIGAVLGFLTLLAILVEPYRMARLTGFLNPGADAAGAGFQAVQAKIALGSGGIFGVGLGDGVQKAYYLPEAHTDMIAAVIGEELGLVGVLSLIGLFGLFGYAGFRTAQRAKDYYGKVLAAGLTSLIMGQAVLNLCAVMGLAPLTGVTLPFVSYGNSSLLVSLAAVGLILNIAKANERGVAASNPGAGGRGLRLVEGGRSNQRSRSSKGASKRRSNAGAKRAGTKRSGASASRRRAGAARAGSRAGAGQRRASRRRR